MTGRTASVARLATLLGALGGMGGALGGASACDRLPGHHPAGPAPDARVIRKLCTSDLGGPQASVQVWRDDQDRVTVLELQPDPDAKAKASAALYDSRGREQLRLPAVEGVATPQALEVQRRRETIFEDSKRSESIDCKVDGGT